MKHKASLESYPTLEIIGDYFTKAITVYQFHRFRNTIIGIHEDDILDYNASGRDLLEDGRLKLKR